MQVFELLFLSIAAVAGLFELGIQQPDQAALLQHLLLRQQLPVPLYAPEVLLHILPHLCQGQHLLQTAYNFTICELALGTCQGARCQS